MSNSTTTIVCPGSADISCVNSGDNAWMLTSTALVLFMTPGLAFFYGGLVRQKNVLNTIQMSLILMGIITVEWVFVGYTFSFGWFDKGFGNGDWVGFRDVGQEPNTDYGPTVSHQVFALFQMSFAIITAAIISGAVVERMGFISWCIYIIFWHIGVYCPLAHWVWAGATVDGEFIGGFLRDLGAIDFAGGTVVHISSGYAALAAAVICGPRRKINLRQPPDGHNIPLFVLGTVILWFGWFGFNGGSAIGAGGLAGLAFTNTQIAAGTALTTWAVLDVITKGAVTVTGPLSGAVVGLVVITPASGYVHPYSSLAIGFIGSAIIFLLVWFKTMLINGRWYIFKYYDDALDVFLAHGMGGTLGALLTGCFASLDANPAGADGLFFGRPILLAYQLVAIMVAISLTVFGTIVILVILKVTIGLRYKVADEVEGVDFIAHKQVAYRIKDIERGVEGETEDSDFQGLRGSMILTKPMVKLAMKAYKKAAKKDDSDGEELSDMDSDKSEADKASETRKAFTGRFGSSIMIVRKEKESKKKKKKGKGKEKIEGARTSGILADLRRSTNEDEGGDGSSSSSESSG